MAFIDQVLQPPSYGWQDEKGELIKPSKKQIVSEMLMRINVFKSIKNWSTAVGWFWVVCLIPGFVVFLTYYFNWWLVLAMIVYGLVIMSTHGTIWYHRYCTHNAYTFRHPVWRFITQNLVVKLIPEEIYVVSHHVHHLKSDKPGDPYNTGAGFLYCFLADTNHQPIAKDMDEETYERTTLFMKHTGIKMNSFKQYQKWGSIAHPLNTAFLWVLNWTFWYTAFYFIGGHALALALFSGAMLWVIGVRTFNYNGHGGGEDKRVEGLDFSTNDLSINQYRPGLLSGEWHNNHHLYPKSARSGFLPNQLDLAWCYIFGMYKLGAVKSFHDSKQQFLERYYNPYKESLANKDK
jgi:fatty-acid desaturase